MPLHFRPLQENLPSWKADAYRSNTPELATITFNITDCEWELRNKFGELIDSHRDRDEMIIELNIWRDVWSKRSDAA